MRVNGIICPTFAINNRKKIKSFLKKHTVDNLSEA